MAKPVTRRTSGVSADVSRKTVRRKASESTTTDKDGGEVEEKDAADEPKAVKATATKRPAKQMAKQMANSATKRVTGVKTAAATVKRTAAVQPRTLVQRVYRAIETELAKLEKQKGATSQDRERASRALSQMVNSLEKAIDMQRDILKSTAPRAKAKDTEALRHAEDLRRQIAERLERLQPKRGAGGGAQ